MIRMKAVGSLSPPSSGDSFIQVDVTPEVNPDAVRLETRNPLLVLLVPINPVHTTVSIRVLRRPSPKVSTVLQVCDHAQVADVIIFSITVNMVDLPLGPLAIIQRPGDPMRWIGFPLEVTDQILLRRVGPERFAPKFEVCIITKATENLAGLRNIDEFSPKVFYVQHRSFSLV